MYRVEIRCGGETAVIYPEAGEILSDVILKNGYETEHPCGGRGTCGKCRVRVNGEEVLSCTYRIKSDITVDLPEVKKIRALSGGRTGKEEGTGSFLALDTGTTTLALALADEKGNIIRTAGGNNPQRKFGADVISRIAYCTENGISALKDCLISKINGMIREISPAEELPMFVSGNMTMLHTFFGIDCSSMGVSPYRPAFLDSRREEGAALGLEGVSVVTSLPGMNAFAGADITAGIAFAGEPEEGKYSLLVDLGTNSEIALFSSSNVFCTSASAGPCFEGANISCGMSAVNGALSRINSDGTYSVIGGTEAEGICATGLIDAVKYMLDRGVIDKTGYMKTGTFALTGDISLTREDIRNYQLAKSAIRTGIEILMKDSGVGFGDIDRFFVAGGFSGELSIDNAVATGLFPPELRDRFISLDNSSLLGTAGYACGRLRLPDTKKARYTDLALNDGFTDKFITNMNF